MIRCLFSRVRYTSRPPQFFAHGNALALLCPPFINSPTGIRFIGKKARSRRRKEQMRATSRYHNLVRAQKRLKGLHPAAQWKRILSSCDYWFSNTNLVDDEFLRTELKNNQGWCRIKTLLTFPKLKHWATPTLLKDAFSNAGPRYQLKYHTENSSAKHALVRRKGVTLEHIEILERNPTLFQVDNTEEIEERATARRKQQSLPNYKTDKEVVLIKKPQNLAKLCEELRESIEKTKLKYDTEDASVLGLDAEYATLEHDIRPGLPAMLQIAAPEGPVGLIWLDKFPNHGRDILNDSTYAPLASLLADSSISKVGVGIDKDAKNLASWWGINDREYVGHFISRLQDLTYVPELASYFPEDDDPKAQMTRLSDICAVVLKRDLVKVKTTKKDKKKSHWRAPDLTKMMKSYAAHDAACAVDIWMALKVTKTKKRNVT